MKEITDAERKNNEHFIFEEKSDNAKPTYTKNDKMMNWAQNSQFLMRAQRTTQDEMYCVSIGISTVEQVKEKVKKELEFFMRNNSKDEIEAVFSLVRFT
jgi:hypothetical protein